MRSFFLLVGVLICTSLFAQTAQIQGTVLDSTGSAVPGADVKATQTGTGAVRTVTSGTDGAYVLPKMPVLASVDPDPGSAVPGSMAKVATDEC